MKDFFKKFIKNKKAVISVAVVFALAVALVLCLALIPLSSNGDDNAEPPLETTASSDTVDVLDISDETADDTSDSGSDTEIIPDGNGITPGSGEAETTAEEQKQEFQRPAETITEDTTTAADTNSGGGIVIGDGGTGGAYNCGSPNHHCANEYTHATIANLELEGCPTCSSHSCPSFYALDEWGNTLYTPNKCPSYNIKNDPVYYCQNCGKPTGNGRNGTCVFFVEDTNCTECGEAVKAWDCHTCK